MIMHEIAEKFQELLYIAKTEDLPKEALKDTFESLNLEFEDKAENTAIVIKELEAVVSKLKKEVERLNNRISSIDNNIKRLKFDLESAMKAAGKTKFNTLLFSFNIQKNGGKLPVIVDSDIEDLPEELVTISKKPNLAAIEKRLKEEPNTDICLYAHFGEREESLRIR